MSDPNGARIIGFGGYQPDQVVTNDDLAKLVDTTDEWIRSRVGIQSRRVARDDETVADMAEAAGAKALAASGLEPSEVDLVIVATCSPEVPLPNVAATVAYRLGIPAPGAYDLNAACAGFCYGDRRNASRRHPGRQSARNVLVIGVGEDVGLGGPAPTDRRWIIFADGAGRGRGRAGGRSPERAEPGIGPVVWGSGRGPSRTRSSSPDRDSVRCSRRASRCSAGPPPPLYPTRSRRAEKAGITVGEHGRVRPAPGQPAHHRGAGPQDRGAARPRRRRHPVTAGNTSSASIPLALARMTERGEAASRAAPALLMGFGAGMCYAVASDHGTLAAPR